MTLNSLAEINKVIFAMAQSAYMLNYRVVLSFGYESHGRVRFFKNNLAVGEIIVTANELKLVKLQNQLHDIEQRLMVFIQSIYPELKTTIYENTHDGLPNPVEPHINYIKFGTIKG